MSLGFKTERKQLVSTCNFNLNILNYQDYQWSNILYVQINKINILLEYKANY